MHFPAPEVTAIDATGAGDSFAGVLVALLAKGRSIEAAVRRAVIAGALATTQRGNKSPFGSEADLDPELWQSSAR
jgi:ribokinase